MAIVPTEIRPQNLSAAMKEDKKKRGLMVRYINENMKSGMDYGTILIGGKQSKPSLFKPGSEKFLSLFKLTALFRKDDETWSMAGEVAGLFCYICELKNSQGTIVGEGRGSANLKEKNNWTVNNAVKIAEKRAQIDAVLRTGALSDFFTQDLEDMVQSYDTSKVADKAVPTVYYDDVETTGEAIEIPTDEGEQWKIITNFAKQLDRKVVDKKGVERVVADHTQLALNPKNFPAIIRELETELQFQNMNR